MSSLNVFGRPLKICMEMIKIVLINQMLTEIEVLDANIKTDLARKPVNTSFMKKISSAMSTIRDPGVLKPLIIINVFNALQLCSGTYIIVFYAVDMIKDIGKKEQYHFFDETLTSIGAKAL